MSDIQRAHWQLTQFAFSFQKIIGNSEICLHNLFKNSFYISLKASFLYFNLNFPTFYYENAQTYRKCDRILQRTSINLPPRHDLCPISAFSVCLSALLPVNPHFLIVDAIQSKLQHQYTSSYIRQPRIYFYVEKQKALLCLLLFLSEIRSVKT